VLKRGGKRNPLWLRLLEHAQLRTADDLLRCERRGVRAR
jgi:hypothetical protein